MALDALEKERLRRKMAQRMAIFLEGTQSVTCVSAHYYDKSHPCDLAQLEDDYHEFLVIKNRSGKKMNISLKNAKEMIRFKVCEVEELSKWLEKLKDLKVEFEKRKSEELLQREEERKRLGKKVILRKRGSDSSSSLPN